MPNLICLRGRDKGQDWELPIIDIEMGRAPTNHVVVHDPKASRQHCKLVMGESTIKIVDLKSRNGTKVEGAPVTDQVLHFDQIFQVGDSMFIISPKTLQARVSEILQVPEDQLEIGGKQWHEILWDELTRSRSMDALKQNSLTKFLETLREDQATEDTDRLVTTPLRPKLSVKDLQRPASGR